MKLSLKSVTRSAPVADRTGQWQLLLLGPPEVRVAAQRLAFPTRKTLALLAYLALADGPQPREHLAALLWPEASPERSRASLRNTLAHLQAALRRPTAPTLLAVTRTSVGLQAETGLELDLRVVEQAYTLARADRSRRAQAGGPADQRRLQAAVATYRGDFLTGFSLGDAPAFDDWVGVQREVWRRRLGLILDRLSEIQFAGGAYAATAETAALWISVDALNEVAYRRKMRAHFAAGERGQALETYTACRALLAAELNAEPDPATERLAARIRTQQRPDQPHPALPPLDTPVTFLGSLFAGLQRGASRPGGGPGARRLRPAATGEPARRSRHWQDPPGCPVPGGGRCAGGRGAGRRRVRERQPFAVSAGGPGAARLAGA